MRTLVRHPVISGAVLGLSWGIVMRAWMRYITDNPEFTWSGTGFILGAATLAGTLMGIAWWRRSKGGDGGWRFTALGILPLGFGAGSIMIPSVLLGAVAIGRRNRWLRLILGLAAVGFQVLFFTRQIQNLGSRTVPAYAWYAVMLGLETWAASIPFRPGLAAETVSDPSAAQDLPIAAT